MATRLIERLRLELERSTSGRWWDMSAAALLLIALTISAQRLIVTEWTEHLSMIQFLVLVGGLTGLALGLSRFSPRRVVAFGLAFGLFFVPWRLGLTLAYVSEDAVWTDRLFDMSGRLSVSFAQLMRQEPVQDVLLFMFFMACLFWALSVHAGYNATRHAHPWRAIFPAGLTLLIIHTYDPTLASRAWFLGSYLFFSLLFVARLTYLRYRARWQQDRVFLHSYVSLDLSRITLQITIVLVLVAWTAPAVASALSPVQSVWEEVSKPWITIRDRMGNAVAALRDQVSGVYNVYGADLLLGHGTELSDDVFLAIEAQPDPPVPLRYYWRARVYDYYEDGQWGTTVVSDTRHISPGRVDLPYPEVEERWTSVFTVTTAVPISTLYSPSDLVWISHAAQADLALNPDDTVEMVAVHATPPLQGGVTYRVRSSLSTATIPQLRAAGTNYPAWVASRYLQLPPDISPRVYELARQLASDLDNPYDIAVAITSYLRLYIDYSETISTRRPPDREPIDWFLFDLREGYCMYYATAEVVMLRSLGIPARLAAGFSEGDSESGHDVYVMHHGGSHPVAWSEDSNIFVVRRRHSHAWPEVYFPGLGWIEFEPTASQPPIYRPPGEDSLDGENGSSMYSDYPTDPRNRWEEFFEEEVPVGGSGSSGDLSSAEGARSIIAIGVLILGLSLSVVAFVWHKRRPADLPPLPVMLKEGLRRFDLRSPAILNRWALHATLPLIARAYLEINYALSRLGAPPVPADTPAERATTLGRLLPAVAESARRLLAQYHAATYSTRRGDLLVALETSRDIRVLSWRAMARRLIGRD